jgi:hypothetical protein
MKWQAEEDTACVQNITHNLIGCGSGTLNVVVADSEPHMDIRSNTSLGERKASSGTRPNTT